MNIFDMLNADRWIKLAFRNLVAILCILLFASLVAHAPFGQLLALGALCFVAYRIWTVRPRSAARPRPRNAASAERTPVLPGGARR
jgi:hypothetical protein